MLGFMRELAEAGGAELEARSLSMHEEVTGLYNRRFLLEMVAVESRRGEGYGGCFSLVIALLYDVLPFHERFMNGGANETSMLVSTRLDSGCIAMRGLLTLISSSSR